MAEPLTPEADDEALVERAEGAYYGADLQVASALLELVRSRSSLERKNPHLLEAGLRAAFCLLLIERRDDPQLLLETSGWVDRYASLRPDRAESFAFRAERAIATIARAESVVEMQLACSEASSLLEEGQRRDPSSLHVTIVSAQFFYALPETFGGGREKARPFYVAASRHPKYGAAMAALMAKKYPPTA